LENVLLNIKEAARFLNIKESRIRTEIFRKKIPYLKIGALIRFRRIDLEKWIESKIKFPVLIN
jgi:excisionase family DNA binding protein